MTKMLAVVAAVALGQMAQSAQASGSVELEFVNSTCVSEKMNTTCTSCSSLSTNLTASQDCYDCLVEHSNTLEECMSNETVSDECFAEAKMCIIDDCVYMQTDDITTCVDDCLANTTACSDDAYASAAEGRDEYEDVEVLNGTCAQGFVEEYCPQCSANGSVEDCLSCVENNTDAAQACVDGAYISDECYSEASACIFDNCTASSWDQLTECADSCVYASPSCMTDAYSSATDAYSSASDVSRDTTTTSTSVEANDTSTTIWNSTCIENTLMSSCIVCVEADATVDDCLSCLDSYSNEFYECLDSDFINGTCYTEAGDCAVASCSSSSWTDLPSCANECIANVASCPEIAFEEPSSSEKASMLDANTTNTTNTTKSSMTSAVNMTCLEAAAQEDCPACSEWGSDAGADSYSSGAEGCSDCLSNSTAVDSCFSVDSECTVDMIAPCLLTECGSYGWNSDCGAACLDNCGSAGGYFSSDYDSSSRRLRGV